ncbi:IclR family transcriptional regulator [Achromobacter spanius]|uniref:IclR family transcriptional regulator n=1 Tax=Achromobacter spanius TaxID=217203 RepID=UPI003209ADCA
MTQDKAAEDKGVTAVDRALSLLGAFREDDYSLTLTELSKRTGLYKSTALRLIDSLIGQNYLYRLSDGSYQLGAKPLQLGAIFQRQLRTVEYVPPFLRRIVEELGESASFYVYQNGGRMCLHRVDANNQVIRDSVREGDWRPLAGGATGTILLAFRNAEGAEFDEVRNKLWAATFGGAHPEMAAVAVPVFGQAQTLMGALSVSGPRYRLEARGAQAMVPTLMRAGRELTALFGGDTSAFDQRLA